MGCSKLPHTGQGSFCVSARASSAALWVCHANSSLSAVSFACSA
ncbi:Uncharacterised protein [Vibrio cholerae]|nr:Uncharacterised protein [Vibrio cholerae]CSD09176.1 Uncharacterised protein [Vibrio cholerae]